MGVRRHSSKRTDHDPLEGDAASGHGLTDGESSWDVFLSYAREDDKVSFPKIRTA